ncbi:50S ribosomal protein L30 [Buchnera aphidicola (Kurisakia onigurumii)]|uniref:50S ribosomal protein L30 n=1 Tax=Buchnera aphidicola TaxID=9 RepID=UPI0031B6D10B
MKLIKITQKKSSIGRLPSHRSTLLGLGLRRINHFVIRNNTKSILGMVKKISYMITVEEVS